MSSCKRRRNGLARHKLMVACPVRTRSSVNVWPKLRYATKLLHSSVTALPGMQHLAGCLEWTDRWASCSRPSHTYGPPPTFSTLLVPKHSYSTDPPMRSQTVHLNSHTAR